MIRFTIPIRIESCANLREHWAKRAKRAKNHREAGRWFTLFNTVGNRVKPTTITLTRIAPRALDSDNLANGCKGLRDGISDALGINDGDTRIEWKYTQRKGKPKEYSVIVEIV